MKLWESITILVLAAGCGAGNPTPTLLASPAPLSAFPTKHPTRVATIYLTPTLTPLPTDTATHTPPPPTITNTSPPDAMVKADANDLRLRADPGENGKIVGHLDALTPLRVIGRSEDNQWVQVVTPAGEEGWVGVAFLTVNVDLNRLLITGSSVTPAPTSVVSVPVPPAAMPHYGGRGALVNITSRARTIYLQGQAMGNRANVFSKVGDSLTVAAYVMTPIGLGTFNLHGFTNLLPVVRHFSEVTARDNNSFANTPLAANNGWTTHDVLDSKKADPSNCAPGETPLSCEYRAVKPAVALILIGTNDSANLSAGEYADNLHQIVQTSIDDGIIPVLTTIPTRVGFEAQSAQLNQIIVDTALSYQVPLSDFGGALVGLPNGGLSPDGVHPSFPTGDYSVTADFTAANLNYGYTVRNLYVLEALAALWQQVMY